MTKKVFDLIGDSHYWESVAAIWGEVDDQALWRRHSDAVNRDLLIRWLPNGKVGSLLKTDVFDEAFGEGLYPILTSRASRVVSMDISGSTLHLAAARYLNLAAVEADVRRLPYAHNAFDIIVSNSTLDHFTSADQIVESLREMHRALAVDGQLLLTMDNLANPAVWLRNALPFKWLKRLGLVRYYVGATCGPWRLRRYLKKAGFEVLETTAILHCPRVLAVAIARYLTYRASKQRQDKFLRLLLAFEKLEFWSTRYLTGYFVAVRAAKRGKANI